jgi:hypothetical protein
MTGPTETHPGGFAEEVGSLFKLWESAEGRECLSSDLTRRGAEEMARQFLQAEDLLEGLESAAEQAVGFGAFIVFGEAKKHAAKARKIAEGYARKEEASS